LPAEKRAGDATKSPGRGLLPAFKMASGGLWQGAAKVAIAPASHEEERRRRSLLVRRSPGGAQYVEPLPLNTIAGLQRSEDG